MGGKAGPGDKECGAGLGEECEARPGEKDGKPGLGEKDGKPGLGEEDFKPGPGEMDGEARPGEKDGKAGLEEEDGEARPGEEGEAKVSAQRRRRWPPYHS